MLPKVKRSERRSRTPEEALAALMRLCARAEKSTGDALRLMHGWGVAPEAQREVLRRLVEQRFIDDARYAAAFVRDKVQLSGWGAYKIRTALQRKGIDRRTVEEALAQLDPSTQTERLAAQLARKARTTKASSPYDLRTKLIRYGLSLGYDYEAVRECAARLTPTTDDTCDDFY